MFDRVPDMAARRAALTPDRTAFIDHESGRRWSFAEVEDAAARMATGLRAMGLKPGDRLTVLTLNRVEFFVALFACWRARVVMAPLNWRQPVPELTEVVNSVGASAVLYDADQPGQRPRPRRGLRPAHDLARGGSGGRRRPAGDAGRA